MRWTYVSLIVLVLAFLVYHFKLFPGRWSAARFETGFRDQLSNGGPWSFKRDNIAVYAIQGRRSYMEDRYSIIDDNTDKDRILAFAIYDGHGGSFFADYAERNLLSSVVGTMRNRTASDMNITQILIDEFLAFDERAIRKGGRKKKACGSTALVGISFQRKIYVANVGDCRAVAKATDAIQITTDHKPDEEGELARIKAAGGFVSFKGVWRVGGSLAMSRAIGDDILKEKGWIIATPDVYVIDLKSANIEYIVLASDGLWDVISSEKSVQFLRSLVNGEELFGAKQLVEKAFDDGSFDNISVMIVKVV